MAPGNFFRSVKSLNGEFMSTVFHLLPLIYPLFTCVDPDTYSAVEILTLASVLTSARAFFPVSDQNGQSRPIQIW